MHGRPCIAGLAGHMEGRAMVGVRLTGAQLRPMGMTVVVEVW